MIAKWMKDQRPGHPLFASLTWLLWLPVLLIAPSAAALDEPAGLPEPLQPLTTPDEISQPTLDDLTALSEPPIVAPITVDRPMNVERDLAGQFIRAARTMLRGQPLTVRAVEAATILAQEAVELDPEDPEAWHFLLDVSLLSERDELVRSATERLVELDPKNDRVLLRHLRSEIETKQTAAERVEHYERLIGRDDVPRTVRSRLALDLAILERRRGGTESFAHWLAESVSLDRANTAAAGFAAGYFRLHVDDPVGTAELLVNQFLANPADISAQMLAANHCLNHGAYAAADRLYTLAKWCYESLILIPTPPGLITDIAIARWGAGRPEEALQVILAYQDHLTVRYRQQLMFEQPELTPLDRAEHQVALPLSAAAVAAAIHVRRGDGDDQRYVDRVVEQYEDSIETILDEMREEGREIDARVEEAIAESWMEAAWLTVWLSQEPHAADTYLTRANELRPVSERAEDRIAGWIALRDGDHRRAIDLLQPHAPKDAAAALGYAEALLAQGRQRSAATELLRIVRRQPGTLIGVWAGDRLAELLGRRVPISNQAAAINSIIDEIPRYLDRFPRHPTTIVSVRLRPAKHRFRPYEPIRVDLEITNHTTMPLAIDPDGPITPDVAILFDVRLAGTRDHPSIEPLIVSINRRLRLEPREKIVIPLDLRQTGLGLAIDERPLSGAIVTMRSISNFFLTPEGAILPNLLGSEHQPSTFNVDGMRITGEALDRMRMTVTQNPGRETLTQMALLIRFLVAYSFQNLPANELQMLIQTLFSLRDVYQQLDPVSQTWLLSVLPSRASAMHPMVEAARATDDRLPMLGLLLFGLASPDDPTVRAGLEHEDPRVRRLAAILAAGPEEFDRLTREQDEETPSALDDEFQQTPEPDDGK